MKPHASTLALNHTAHGYSWFIILSGFLPVSSIVLHCLGILSLQLCLVALILPAINIAIIGGIKIPSIGKIALAGWLAGIVAVALYDLSRVPFILNGWSDFIPKIGAWVTNSNEKDAFLGYLWRYTGNGGGMGAAFFVLMHQFRSQIKRKVLFGFVYGLFIFASLMCILLLFEQAGEMMFKITPFTFTGSLVGHMIYGSVLGLLARKFYKNK